MIAIITRGVVAVRAQEDLLDVGCESGIRQQRREVFTILGLGEQSHVQFVTTGVVLNIGVTAVGPVVLAIAVVTAVTAVTPGPLEGEVAVSRVGAVLVATCAWIGRVPINPDQIGVLGGRSMTGVTDPLFVGD